MPRYIDADALLERMKRDPLFPLVEKYGVSGVIEAEPTADVRENVHGKWLFDDGNVATGIFQDKNVHCSICGHSAPSKPWWECHLELTKFCPNCGAQMEEKGECG